MFFHVLRSWLAALLVLVPAIAAGVTSGALCPDCSPEEARALERLLGGQGLVVAQNNEYVALDTGVALHRECLTVFGPRLPVLVHEALERGVRCMGSYGTAPARSLVREMAHVLGRQSAPRPVFLCRELYSDHMKGVGLRSDDPARSPYIILSPVLKGEPDEYIRSVIFHEFLHLGGDGHQHGAHREVAGPCQHCCFEAMPLAHAARPYACRVCTTDYPDKFAPEYLGDLAEWALRTPGSEFIFRVNMLDGVKRAGGDVRFMAQLLEHFRDHPFGFEMARMAAERYAWPEDAERQVRAIARKQHGHVTKLFIPVARAVAEAAMTRFEAGADPAGATGTLEAVSGLLAESSLPDREKVDRLDLPYFYKYYYEFALLRGVMAEEVHGLWLARHNACAKQEAASQDVAKQEAAGLEVASRETACREAAHRERVFACQKVGLDYDARTGRCR